MNYEESRAYIRDAERKKSIVLGLDNMKELMKRLGDPQDDLKYVHVAGTNGKGSVIAYLYSALSGAGYRVGRYISPAVYSYRERMEVNGEPVSEEKFAACVTRVREAICEIAAEGRPYPTAFEIETAAAFLFFKEEKCDLVLMEVGMGGDLDATNIIRTTVLSVLVSISMDHTAFLGNTLGEIAEKKAGIIKAGSHMITAKQKPEAEKVIKDTCEKLGVPYAEADGNSAEILKAGLEGQTFCYEGEEFTTALAGTYQKENAVLALGAMKLLDKLGYPTTLKQKQAGLSDAKWPGRFTLLAKDPAFVVDGAHNPAAADMLEASIQKYFKGKRIIYIMGMFRDKDYRSVISKTSRYAETILTIAAPGNPRALTPEELAGAVREFHKDVRPFDRIEEAVDEAYRLANPEDVIIAFGSLAFLGDLTEIIKKHNGGKHD
nr:folylpolyglutamate synthase/dihydrofolate synthase family protein [uncultured Blautia sp.]